MNSTEMKMKRSQKKLSATIAIWPFCNCFPEMIWFRHLVILAYFEYWRKLYIFKPIEKSEHNLQFLWTLNPVISKNVCGHYLAFFPYLKLLMAKFFGLATLLSAETSHVKNLKNRFISKVLYGSYFQEICH